MSVKPANILSGKTLAAQIQDEIKAAIAEFLKQGHQPPCLCALQVSDDPSAKWYLGQQEKLAGKLGVRFEKVPAEKMADQKALVRQLESVSKSPEIHGVFLTMPLPGGFDADKALFYLDPRKDVEGIHPANLGLLVLRRAKLIPSTAYAAFRLIESTGLSLRGKKATLIGQSAIVGRPLQLLLGQHRVMTIVCNTGTPEGEIAKAVSESDIVVACAGKPGLVQGEWIRPGAVVIDVGTTEVEGKLVGDVEFEKASERAGFITPVPGGVGPLTVTMLMQNLIHAYRWQRE